MFNTYATMSCASAWVTPRFGIGAWRARMPATCTARPWRDSHRRRTPGARRWRRCWPI